VFGTELTVEATKKYNSISLMNLFCVLFYPDSITREIKLKSAGRKERLNVG